VIRKGEMARAGYSMGELDAQWYGVAAAAVAVVTLSTTRPDFLFDSITEMELRQRAYREWEQVLPRFVPPLPKPPVPAHVAQVRVCVYCTGYMAQKMEAVPIWDGISRE
jgi:hypothetical protein